MKYLNRMTCATFLENTSATQLNTFCDWTTLATLQEKFFIKGIFILPNILGKSIVLEVANINSHVMFSSVQQLYAQQTEKTQNNGKCALNSTSIADPATVTGHCEVTTQCGASNHNKLIYIHKSGQWSRDTPKKKAE